MSYTINRSFKGEGFDSEVERTRAALAEQGFGVLTKSMSKQRLKKR